MGDLSSALKVYFGLPGSPYPRAHPNEVMAVFGEQMVAQVEHLIGEVGALEVNWQSHSPLSAMRWVEAEMRHRHPELSSDAISNLGWAWSYWNK